MRVAVIQQQNTADLDANLARSMDKIREAAAQGAQLVMLQELHRSLYFCQSEDTAMFDLAETVPGPSTDALGALARELQVVIVASLFEKRATASTTTPPWCWKATAIWPALYRKMHIPDDPGFYEKFYFTPGDATFNAGHSGFTPIRTSVGKLGLLVCWDQLVSGSGTPDGAGRRRPAALPHRHRLGPHRRAGRAEPPAGRLDHRAARPTRWPTACRCWSPNRTGFEPGPDGNGGIDFWGNSFVCGPQGEYLARAGRDQEQTLVVDLDMARSEEVRRIWPYLRDRRVDAYQDLTKRYRD